MRTLKKILLALLIIIALALLIAIFVDGKVKYEKSITINAPIEKVWGNVNSLGAINKWSPWNDKDPNMKTTMEGADGTPGAKFCWESNKKDVGKGCQSIKSLKAPELVETDLKFLTPYESEAQAYIKLQPAGSGTTATWGFNSEMPYPFRLMKLFTNMEDMIGADYKLGLERLKKMSEGQ